MINYHMRYQSTSAEISTLDKIDLLIGPYRSGKSWSLLEQALENSIKYPFESTTIVVPSKRYSDLLDERIEQLFVRKFSQPNNGEAGQKRAGFVGLKIQTFYQFCRTILMRMGSFDLVVPDAVRPTLIARILGQRKAEGQLQALSSIAEFRGTPLAVLSLIDELERAALSPEQVTMHLQKSLATHSRYVELAEIYKDYWQSLDSIKHVDKRRLVFKLLQVLMDQKNSASFGFIAFDGFDRFNPLQLKTIHELARHSRKLIVSFDYLPPEEDHEQMYLWKKNSYAQLRAILGEKLAFNRELRQANGSQPEQPRKVSIEKFVTTDRYFEMTQIAAQIKEAVVRQSKKLADFLVVARNLKPYKSAVKSAFHDAGLDFFVDEAIELKALPVVQFILSIASLYQREFPRAETIIALRSPYFSSKFKLTAVELEELDAYSLDYMVVGGKEQWKEALDHCPMPKLCSKVEAIFDLLTPVQRDGFPDEYVSWIENVLDLVLVLPGADDHLDPFEHWEQDSALSQFRNCLAVLIQEQTILKQLGDQNKYSYESLFVKLEKLIDNANFRRQPRSKNYVLITEADLAPNRLFDVIYIAGMVEGEFPQRAHQSGFTTIDGVEAWSRCGVDIHNPRFDPNFETALFRSLKERASSKLVLSCPQNEMSGEELTPSFFLQDTEANVSTCRPSMHSLENFLANPNSPRNAMAAYLWTGKLLELPTPLLNNQLLAEFAENLQEPLTIAQGRISNSKKSVLNGYLGDHVAAGLVKVTLPEYWSASRLSDYGKCPFRFWVSHIAGIRPQQEPEATLTTNIVGETYHKALELFYRELIAKGLSFRQSDEALLSAIFDQAVASAIAWLNANAKVRKGEFWHYDCEELKFRLKRFFYSERDRAMREDFEPLLVEASFGLKEEGQEKRTAFPALALKNGDREILIRGRIDRVDVSRTGEEKTLRIIDYKSGSTWISKEEVLSGRNMQLPLYALAMERAIVPGSKVQEGQYLSISQAASIGNFKFDKFDETEAGEQQTLPDRAEALTKQFVNSIQQGDFSVRPTAASVCSTCEHMMICRIRELETTEQVEDDSD